MRAGEERAGDAAGDDRYRPREHDHLVEPFFAGLGHGAEEATEEPVPRGWRGLLSRLRRALSRRRSPRGPASRPGDDR